MIDVYPIETLVEFVQREGVFGKVTAVMVESGDAVSYRVAWWSGRERRSEWVTAAELQTATDLRTRLGFHTFSSAAIKPITEGRMSKGGWNEINPDAVRPPAPLGSGT